MAAKKKETVQEEFRKSAHRIWLAGLGALSAAEEEGGRLFNLLVDRGRQYEAKGKTKAREAKARAGSAWEKIETTFDETVTAALRRVGVPTRKGITDLIDRVDSLTRTVQGKSPGSAKKKAKKTVKKKTAKKKKAVKKKKKTARK